MLHFGGPLSGPVVAIHQNSQYAEAETGDGIYVAAQKQHLEDLVRRRPGPYRLIVGHLGWESGQLEAEIEAGIWHVLPATTDAVFSSANQMWPRLIRRATSSSMARWLGIPDLVAAGELN
jgi:putative transcriptional regulator